MAAGCREEERVMQYSCFYSIFSSISKSMRWRGKEKLSLLGTMMPLLLTSHSGHYQILCKGNLLFSSPLPPLLYYLNVFVSLPIAYQYLVKEMSLLRVSSNRSASRLLSVLLWVLSSVPMCLPGKEEEWQVELVSKHLHSSE